MGGCGEKRERSFFGYPNGTVGISMILHKDTNNFVGVNFFFSSFLSRILVSFPAISEGVHSVFNRLKWWTGRISRCYTPNAFRPQMHLDASKCIRGSPHHQMHFDASGCIWGWDEQRDAFGAVMWLQPICVSTPKCISTRPDASRHVHMHSATHRSSPKCIWGLRLHMGTSLFVPKCISTVEYAH